MSRFPLPMVERAYEAAGAEISDGTTLRLGF